MIETRQLRSLAAVFFCSEATSWRTLTLLRSRGGRSYTNPQKNLVAKLISEAFKFRSTSILYWMGYEDAGSIKANSSPLYFKGVHEFFR